jgi:hypothetical protein
VVTLDCTFFCYGIHELLIGISKEYRYMVYIVFLWYSPAMWEGKAVRGEKDAYPCLLEGLKFEGSFYAIALASKLPGMTGVL